MRWPNGIFWANLTPSSPKVTDEYVAGVLDTFGAFDTNGDGRIRRVPFLAPRGTLIYDGCPYNLHTRLRTEYNMAQYNSQRLIARGASLSSTSCPAAALFRTPHTPATKMITRRVVPRLRQRPRSLGKIACALGAFDCTLA
jgi:hypothetical protein